MSMPAPAAPAQRCGIDSVEIARIERLLRETSPQDLLRFFTAQELADAGEGPGRAASLAARFAAKEAAIKAFSRPDAPFVPREIEVVSDGSVPTLSLTGRAAALADEQGWQQITVSLSHAECHAAAVVVAVCRESWCGADTAPVDRLGPPR